MKCREIQAACKAVLTMRCTLNPRSTGAVCTGKINIALTNLDIVGKGPAIQSQCIKHEFLEGITFQTCLIYDIDIVSLAVNSTWIFV